MATARKPAPATPHVKADALGDGIAFEFEGETYVVPPTSEWELDAMEAAEDGKALTFVKLLLGADQWARFRKGHSKSADLERFSDKMAEAAGLGN